LTVSGAAISVLTDTAATIYQCHKISKLYDEKQISLEEKKTEIIKKVSSTVGSASLGICLGTAGAFVGNCIVPGFGIAAGCAIGNFAGNIAGKIAGHAVANKISQN
jgi:hypothetical protein